MDIEKRTKPRITKNNYYDEAGRPGLGKLGEYDPYRNDALLYKVTFYGETRLMYLDKEVTDVGRATADDEILAILRLEGGGSKLIAVGIEEFIWISSAIRPPVRRFIRK